jgi:hypothetical protein
MLKHDYYYVMGRAHLFCQDHMMQSDEPIPLLALADGCSSSPHSDIGARILTTAVKKLIEHYLPAYHHQDAGEWAVLPDYAAFGRMVLMEAQQIAKLMNVDASALDATLMVAFASNGMIHVYMYGDGCIFLKQRDGKTGYIEVSFSNNMPYYLSYWSAPELILGYEQQCGNSNTLELEDSLQGIQGAARFDKALSFSFPLEDYELIAIASDGAGQFLDTTTQQKLPLRQIAEEMLKIPNTSGEFVKRRLLRLLQEYAQAGIHPLDDVAVGVFATTDYKKDYADYAD